MYDENEFLTDLQKETGIVDVYFFKGKLVVINDYDADDVEEFLTTFGYDHVKFDVVDHDMDSEIHYG